MLEDYFLYRRTTEQTRRFSASSVSALKRLFTELGKIHERPELPEMFLKPDYPKEPVRLYRPYSEEEIARIHKAVRSMDPQMTRCILLHELLGTRISETLTLTQNCLEKCGGLYYIRVCQVKNGRTYTKPVSEEAALLIEASIRWTNGMYGSSPYVFAKKSNPEQPMPYSAIQYALKKCFYDNELVADNGEELKGRTHTFRRTYGQRLADMMYDDAVIAKLLGHANTTSVRYYRKVSGKVLAEELKDYLAEVDQMILEITKDWKA